jgi:hypothetical protein
LRRLFLDSIPGVPVEGLMILIGLVLVFVLILLSKMFTKLWLYMLLATPCWTTTLYTILTAVINGESIVSILANHVSNMLFILAPIDLYLVGSESLYIYGIALIAIWTYIITLACRKPMNGKLLVITPLIIWVLGKGLPNTFQLLGNFIPDWLVAYSGLPLVLLLCAVIGVVKYLIWRL